MFSGVRRYTMSRSTVTWADPCAVAAIPPMMTKSTPPILGRHPLAGQECLLAFQPPAVAAQRAVAPDHPMAGDGDGDQVGAAGGADRPHGAGGADPPGQLRVGGGRSARDVAQGAPDP